MCGGCILTYNAIYTRYHGTRIPVFQELRVIDYYDYINPSFHRRRLLSSSSPVFLKLQFQDLMFCACCGLKIRLQHSYVLQQFHNLILYLVMKDSA